MMRVIIFLTIILLSYGAFGRDEEAVKELDKNIQRIDQGIDITKEQITGTRDLKLKPELLMRLADLYVEKSRIVHTRIMAQNRGIPVEEIDFGEVKEIKIQGIETYKRILEEFPKLGINDRVMYFLAYEYGQTGDHTSMIRTYKKLAETYPHSKFRDDSLLQIANYYFDRKQNFVAQSYYEKIDRSPNVEVYMNANFKLGWLMVYKERFHDALKYYSRVLEAKADGYEKGVDLKKEAILAMVWPFTETQPSSRGIEHFGVVPAVNYPVADRVHKVGLAESDTAVYKERVIGLAWRVRNSTAGGIGELVASADNKGVKCEFGAQEYAAARELGPSVLLACLNLLDRRGILFFKDLVLDGDILLQLLFGPL